MDEPIAYVSQYPRDCCSICGEVIEFGRSWHDSWRGLNHALCEMNEDRLKLGLPLMETLTQPRRIELPLVSTAKKPGRTFDMTRKFVRRRLA